MTRFCSTLTMFTAAAGMCVGLASASLAAMPAAETLLPPETKALVSIPDIHRLSAKWGETSMGQLAKDPAMKPFLEEMETQFHERLTGKASLHIGPDDLDGVSSGEIAVAFVQPENDASKHCQALLADITGNHEKAAALVAKFKADRLADGWFYKDIEEGADTVGYYYKKDPTLPGGWRKLFEVVVDDTLIFSTDISVLRSVVGNLKGNPSKAIDSVPDYIKVRDRVAAAMPGDAEIIWYAEPFGYSEVVRASRGGRKRKGTDVLRVLQEEGFTGIRAVGGRITFDEQNAEVLHRTFVYAPGPFVLAARMMQFPGTEGDLKPMSWVPANVGSFSVGNWKIADGFSFSKSLVNNLSGDEVFDDVIRNLKEDPAGPKIDVQKEFINLLEDEICLLSDVEMPIAPDCERMLLGAPIKPADAHIVTKTVEKAMKNEPTASSITYKGHTIHVIKNEEDDALQPPKLDGPGGFGVHREPNEPEAKPIPNSAVAVIQGGVMAKDGKPYLLISSHEDLIKKVIDNEADLNATEDYKRIQTALEPYDDGSEAIRVFARNYVTQRASYELIRAGKMPESESIVGRVLNELLGDAEEEGLRKPRVNGKKLPPFAAVEKYFGISGVIMNTEKDGWFVTGVTLPREEIGVPAE